MGFVTWIIAGALLGGAASTLIGTRDHRGFALNVAAGIAGVMFAGWLLGLLIGTSAFEPGEFSLGGLLVSLLGAAVLLGVLHELRGIRYLSDRTEMKATPGTGRTLRPLPTAGHAGNLLLAEARASTPLANESARDRLALADNAVRDKNMVGGERFARESQVQA